MRTTMDGTPVDAQDPECIEVGINPIAELAEEENRLLLPTFEGIDVAELAVFENQPVDWIVDYVFSSDQPTIFGAASKVGKTTQLSDLAVSLAMPNTDQDPPRWLGCFPVSRRRKVLFITGEANNRAASKRIGKALRVRNLDWSDVSGWLRVEAVDFPTLPNLEHRIGIAEGIKKHGTEIVIVDPLYRGLSGLDTNKLVDIGGAIVEFSKACQPASLILSHHTTKAAARELGPPTLESLSGAGLAESCGNWWLLGRNEPYAFDRLHDLSVVYGGRDEQSGLKRIVFNEADWTFEITAGQEMLDQKQREKEAKRQEEKQTRINEAKAGIKHALANQKEARPKVWIEDRTGATQKDTRLAIAELLNDGTIVEAEYLDSKNRTQKGLTLSSPK